MSRNIIRSSFIAFAAASLLLSVQFAAAQVVPKYTAPTPLQPVLGGSSSALVPETTAASAVPNSNTTVTPHAVSTTSPVAPTGLTTSSSGQPIPDAPPAPSVAKPASFDNSGSPVTSGPVVVSQTNSGTSGQFTQPESVSQQLIANVLIVQNQLGAALAKLDAAQAKIIARLNAFSAPGKNTIAIEAKLTLANAALASAQTAVSALSKVSISSTDPLSSLSALEAADTAARVAIENAQQALIVTLTLADATEGIPDPDTNIIGTSTSSI